MFVETGSRYCVVVVVVVVYTCLQTDALSLM